MAAHAWLDLRKAGSRSTFAQSAVLRAGMKEHRNGA